MYIHSEDMTPYALKSAVVGDTAGWFHTFIHQRWVPDEFFDRAIGIRMHYQWAVDKEYGWGQRTRICPYGMGDQDVMMPKMWVIA